MAKSSRRNVTLRSRSSQEDRSRQVAKQALWYVGTFFITWIPASILRLLELKMKDDSPALFPVAMISQVMFPLQGVFVFMVYISPRYRFFREHNCVGSDGNVLQQRGRLESLLEAIRNKKSIKQLRRTGQWKKSVMIQHIRGSTGQKMEREENAANVSASSLPTASASSSVVDIEQPTRARVCCEDEAELAPSNSIPSEQNACHGIGSASGHTASTDPVHQLSIELEMALKSENLESDVEDQA